MATSKKAKTRKTAAKSAPKKAQAHNVKHANVQHKAKQVKGATDEKVDVEESLVDLEILKHPLVTEKAVNMIEAENKISFIVNGNATKPLVRKAVESLYKVKVKKVNIVRDMKARKRAIVTLDKSFKAGDVATKMGVI
ncbi:MAG TPA: 50S ribosomal protein L23 [archaeon]|nr:50S ribosomal protein L23 [archaeon]